MAVEIVVPLFRTCWNMLEVAFPRPLGDLRSQLLYPSEPGEVATRPVRRKGPWMLAFE